MATTNRLKSEQIEKIISIEQKLGVGAIFTPKTTFQVTATDPSIYIAGDSVDQKQTIRFLEYNGVLAGSKDSYLGAFIRYDGSTNKMYFGVHNSDDFVSENDNPRIIIDRENGNVGIGVSSPTATFEVSTSASNNVQIEARTTLGGNSNTTITGSTTEEFVVMHSPKIPYLKNGSYGFTGTTLGSVIQFYGEETATNLWKIGIPSSVGTDKFGIVRGSTEFFQINNAGQVILGKNSTSNIVLQVGQGVGKGDGLLVGSYTNLGETYSSATSFFGHNVSAKSNNSGIMQITATHATMGARALELHASNGFIFHAVSGSVTAGDAFSGEVMRIQNDGKVGIGDTNPSEKLSVNGNIYLSNGTSNALMFRNVGINTPTFTSRSIGTKVILYPNMGASSTDFAIGYGSGVLWHSVTQAVSGYSHRFYGGTTELMRIQGDGKVGIGTSAPNVPLHVRAGTGTGLFYGLQLTNYYNTTDAGSVGMLFGVVNAETYGKGAIAYERTATYGRGNMHFLQNNVADTSNPALTDAVMTITADGKVGVGTKTPYYRHTISFNNSTTDMGNGGTGNFDGDGLRIQNLNSTVGARANIHYRVDSSDVILSAITQGTNNPKFAIQLETNEHIVIAHDGNTAIKAVANAPTLTIGRYTGQPTIKADNTGSGDLIIDSYDATSQIFLNQFHAGSVYIASGGGLVAVGKSLASYKLDVKGDAINLEDNDAVTFRMTADLDGTPRLWALQTKVDGTFNLCEDATTCRITVLEGGNVGIGNTNPTRKLDVAGDARVLNTLSVESTTAPLVQVLSSATDSQLVELKLRGSKRTDATAPFVRISAYNNPNNVEQARGYLEFINGTTTQDAQNTDIVFRQHNGTAVTETLRIKHDGNIITPSTMKMLNLYLGEGTTEGNIYKVDSIYGANDILFGIGSTRYMRLDTSGFRVGDISATARQWLDVVGNGIISGNVGIGTTTVTGARLQLGDATNSTTDEVLLITSKASAGIKLIADTDNVTESHNPYIYMAQDSSSIRGTLGFCGATAKDPMWNDFVGVVDNGMLLGVLDAYSLQFGTSANVRMTILSDGKVGIGTNAPARTLDVVGTLRVSDGSIYANSTAVNFMKDNGTAIAINVGKILVSDSYTDVAPANGLYVKGDSHLQGNVGVGYTDPTEKLTVNGAISIEKKVKMEYNDTSKTLDFIFA